MSQHSKQPVTLNIEDGYVRAIYHAPIVTLDIAKEIVEYRLKFCSGKDYPYLIEGFSTGSLTKEARDFFSTPEGTAGVSAAAILGNSAFYATLGNFIIKVARPSIPAQLFKNRRTAVAWLMQYAEN